LRHWIDEGLPSLPAWIASLPIVGTKIQFYWDDLGRGDYGVLAELRKFAAPVAQWLLNSGANLAQGLLLMTMSILLAFFFYSGGEGAVTWLKGGMYRIAGKTQSEHLLELTGNTVKGVIYGILGSALAQALLAGLGFWAAGVPLAGVLAILTFFLSVLPGGPAILWIPASLWLFGQGDTGWAIFLALWGTLVVSTIDNVIKPLFIGKSSALPFILIMLGVIGGALAFGFLGIFIGPTLLAVGYSVLGDWAVGSKEKGA
jgi:predicted PurR-regulated permease PerM